MDRETYFDGTSYTALNSKSECVQKLGDLEDKIERGELVEVVRCGECSHSDRTGCSLATIYCDLHGMFIDVEFGCERGERSGENDTEG